MSPDKDQNMPTFVDTGRPHPAPAGGSSGLGPRFMLYSHDGAGLGHIRRNLNIAAALTRACPHASALIVTGSEDLSAFDMPRAVDVLRLPGLRKVDNSHYTARRLPVEPESLRRLRACLLETAVDCFRPHVLLADKHPAGVGDELLPALRKIREQGGAGALGLRDVLDTPEVARSEWKASGSLRHVEELHDAILIYGDEDLLDPLRGWPLPPGVRERIRHCGYVVGEHARSGELVRVPGCPLVVGTAGGGEDGDAILRTFVAASDGAPWDALAISGPQAGAAGLAGLKRRAKAAGVGMVEAIPELARKLGQVDALVCMGGYNTLAEALAAATPAVCVPRVVPRREQLIRARAFGDRGLVRLVEPSELNPERLRAEIEAALGTDRSALASRIAGSLSLDGARRAAEALLELAGPAVRRHRRQVVAL